MQHFFRRPGLPWWVLICLLFPHLLTGQTHWVQMSIHVWAPGTPAAPAYTAWWRWACDSLGAAQQLTAQQAAGNALWAYWLPDPSLAQATDAQWWAEVTGLEGTLRPATGDSIVRTQLQPGAFPHARGQRLAWQRDRAGREQVTLELWGEAPIPGLRQWRARLHIDAAPAPGQLPTLAPLATGPPGLGVWLITGPRLPAGRGTLTLAPLWRNVGFTPMDGFFFEDSIGYRQAVGRRGFFDAGLHLRYSLATAQPGADLRLRFTPGPAWAFELAGGDIFRQFHPQVDRFGNSVPTLLLGGNLIRLFREQYIGGQVRWSPHSDWALSLGVRQARRSDMPLRSDFQVWSGAQPYTQNLHLTPHFQRELTLGLQWQAGQKMLYTPDGPRPEGSRAPMVAFTAIRAWPRTTGDAEYWRLEVSLASAIRKSLPGLRWQGVLRGGWFPQAQRVYLSDYLHFKGNETLVRSGTYDEFMLLPFYQASAPLPYLEGHLERRLHARPLGQRNLRSPVYLLAGLHGLWQQGRTPWLEASAGIEVRVLGLMPVRLDLGLLLLGDRSGSRMKPMVSALPAPAYRP